MIFWNKRFQLYEFTSLAGCSTLVGASAGYPFNGSREISLTCLFEIANEQVRVGVITHEIGHALGFVHEHQRANADEYRRVYNDRLMRLGAVEMNAARDYTYAVTDYDFRSIMHYSFIAWSNVPNRSLDDESTWSMVPLVSEQEKAALVAHFKSSTPALSNNDITGTNRYYNDTIANTGLALEEISICRKSDFDKNKCEPGHEAFQLVFESSAFNYGPWDAKGLQVFIRINEIIKSYRDFTVLPEGNEQYCEIVEQYLIRCVYDHIAPMEKAVSRISKLGGTGGSLGALLFVALAGFSVMRRSGRIYSKLVRALM